MVLDQANEVAYQAQLEATVELLEERLAALEFAKDDVGWTQLGGESSYEFTRDFLTRIVARSRLFFLHNPLINRAVGLQSDYVFAQGVNLQATNDDVNAVIQEWRDDKGNQKEITGHYARLMKEQTLMIDGNVFFVLFTDPTYGFVNVRSILLDEVVDIRTNPDDQNDVWYYIRQWYDTESKTVNYLAYPDIDYTPQRRPGTVRSLGKDISIEWNAPIYHAKVGGLAKSRFGVPETYAALDWALTYRKLLEDWATIVRAYAMFAFKLTTPGGKQSIAAAKTRLGTTTNAGTGGVETNPPPITASIFTRNKDGVDIEPIKTAGATTSAKDGREIRLMVAAAMGIPDTMLSGDADTGNLATAKTLDRPTELKFRSRQMYWTEILNAILKYVIKWAIIAPQGPLRKMVTLTRNTRTGETTWVAKQDSETGKPVALNIEVVFPPILEHSVLDRIEAVTNAVTLNGKQIVVDSPEAYRLTMRLMFQALGLSDIDELIDTIFANFTPVSKDNQNDGQDSSATNGSTDRQATGV